MINNEVWQGCGDCGNMHYVVVNFVGRIMSKEYTKLGDIDLVHMQARP